MDKQLPVHGTKTFEELKQSNEHGAEYWSARDLQPMLGYSQWRRFEDAVKRAMTSCEASGNNPDHHFAGAGKMVDLGSGIPPAEHIKEVEKRLKNTTPKLELDEREAGGLLGEAAKKSKRDEA